MAWNDSFNRKHQAVNAISSRGWNPMNYALLETFKIKESGSINIESRYGAEILDKLIEQRSRDDGNRRQLEGQVATQQNKRAREEFLKSQTRITSSKLAGNGMFPLDSDVLNRLEEINTLSDNKKKEAAEVRKVRKSGRANKLQTVAQKYVANPDGPFNVNEMKSLLAEAKEPTNSTVKSKKSEFQNQFHRRVTNVQAMIMNRFPTLAVNFAATADNPVLAGNNATALY